jgi:hypothetical protein
MTTAKHNRSYNASKTNAKNNVTEVTASQGRQLQYLMQQKVPKHQAR